MKTSFNSVHFGSGFYLRSSVDIGEVQVGPDGPTDRLAEAIRGQVGARGNWRIMFHRPRTSASGQPKIEVLGVQGRDKDGFLESVAEQGLKPSFALLKSYLWGGKLPFLNADKPPILPKSREPLEILEIV